MPICTDTSCLLIDALVTITSRDGRTCHYETNRTKITSSICFQLVESVRLSLISTNSCAICLTSSNKIASNNAISKTAQAPIITSSPQFHHKVTVRFLPGRCLTVPGGIPANGCEMESRAASSSPLANANETRNLKRQSNFSPIDVGRPISSHI